MPFTSLQKRNMAGLRKSLRKFLINGVRKGSFIYHRVSASKSVKVKKDPKATQLLPLLKKAGVLQEVTQRGAEHVKAIKAANDIHATRQAFKDYYASKKKNQKLLKALSKKLGIGG